MLPLIAAAIGASRAIAGGVQANQEYQRKRGLIGQAYRLGQGRLNLEQGDTRQSFGEQGLARGLGVGGGIVDTGAVRPGQAVNVGGAHDLGSQGTLDLEREQSLQQSSLEQQKNAALSDAHAERNAGIIGGILGGAQTGVQAAVAGQQLGALTGGGGGAGAVNPTTTSMSPVTQAGAASPWGGIDPIDPLGRGRATTGGFNVYQPGGMY